MSQDNLKKFSKPLETAHSYTTSLNQPSSIQIPAHLYIATFTQLSTNGCDTNYHMHRKNRPINKF